MADGNWRTLSSATSDTAYGALGASEVYPRAWMNPQGNLFILTLGNLMYKPDTSDTGIVSKYTRRALGGRSNLPSVMFATGKMLPIHKDRVTRIIDINGTLVTRPYLLMAGSGLMVAHQRVMTWQEQH